MKIIHTADLHLGQVIYQNYDRADEHRHFFHQRAEYGKQVIKSLSEELVKRYGRGFSMRNLYYFIDFYQDHDDFFQLTVEKHEVDADKNILQSLTAKSDTVSSVAS